MTLPILSRRSVLLGAGATMALGGCSNPVGSTGAQEIDGRVAASRNYLYTTYPATQELAGKASGILWMPLITKAGFGVGGSYGRGALTIRDATVDYYAVVEANFGFQIGAQQYAHVLFFMTPTALRQFRISDGFIVGANAEFAFPDAGANLSADSLTAQSPVIAFVYGQSGLILGATLEGTKYTRIIP